MVKTVLVAEDHPDSQAYIVHVVRSLGYRTLVASTTEEVVRVATAARPDLVLMDVLLAAGDGLAAARQLKAARDTAAIPILAVTGLSLERDREQCLSAGCDDYLSKPFTARHLATKVRALLGDKRRGDELPSWLESWSMPREPNVVDGE